MITDNVTEYRCDKCSEVATAKSLLHEPPSGWVISAKRHTSYQELDFVINGEVVTITIERNAAFCSASCLASYVSNQIIAAFDKAIEAQDRIDDSQPATEAANV